MASDLDWLLHVWLHTIPMSAEGHSLMKSTEPHHLLRAEKQFLGSQTGHSPQPDCTLRSMKITNRISGRGQSWWSHTPTENVTFCTEYGHSSHFSYTRTRWLIAMDPCTSYSCSTTTRLPGGHGNKPSPSPQNTCRLDEQTPMTPLVTLQA